jgi:hypothetical protein
VAYRLLRSMAARYMSHTEMEQGGFLTRERPECYWKKLRARGVSRCEAMPGNG